MAAPDLPPSLVGLAIDRVDLLGFDSIDRRDANAVLSLIAAGMDPEKVDRSKSRERARLSETLNLDVTGWPRVIAGLEAQGIISRRRHDGRRDIAR
jgi:hypothetical protein